MKFVFKLDLLNKLLYSGCMPQLSTVDMIFNVNTSGSTKKKTCFVDYIELKTYAKFQCGSLSSFKAISK